MKAATYLVISVITVINLNYLCLADPVLMCYYLSRARLRTTMAKFEIKNINFTLCTHYIYLSAHIDSVSRTMVAKDPQVEEGPSGLYREFVDAKNNFTSIKTLLSVGGYEEYYYSQIKAIGENDTILSHFVTSAVGFLRQHGFDGLEINLRSVAHRAKHGHSNVLKALRAKFDEDTNDRLILTATCPGIEMYIDRGYDVVSMATSVDYAILATHQMHVFNSTLAMFHSPLFSSQTEPPLNKLSVNVTVHAWNSRGMPFNKMVVGLTGRGRFLQLANKSDYEPWAPVTQANKYGPFYSLSKTYAYIEICKSLATNGTQKYYDDVQKSPYLVANDMWVSYDDSESLDVKTEWVRRLGAAGVMFSGLDEDDFLGTWCGKGKFPLVAAMKNALTRILPETEDTEHSYNTTVSPTGDNVTDHDVNDTIVRETVLKDTAEEDSNVLSNLLYIFLIVLIPIVCLAMFFLFRRRGRQEGEE